ncbi:hypothetical protein [Flammeovirga sp. SubArs3]|uniref:hypothetical protein n=1 Tax=Flammeovirga sp. SubArs3 TaxID=2995316 RepID=UPI00248C315B|nr:hypothetical protein [Flammeovirga sp. SubArs3]
MKKQLVLISLLLSFFYSSAQELEKIKDYKGWKWEDIYILSNEFISVAVVPEAGGRVLEYSLDQTNSLWVNPKEFGNKYSSSDEVKSNQWRNFGGYRLVPTPVENCALGADGKRSKRWPPPVVIGDAPYTVTKIEEKKGQAEIDIQSGVQHLPVPKWIPKEKRFSVPKVPEESMQYSRSLSIDQNSSKVYYLHTLKNVGKTTIERGIMLSSQHQSWSDVKKQDGENFVAYIPFSPELQLPDGKQYHINVTPESHWRFVNRRRFPLDKNNPEHVEKFYNIGTNWTGEVAPGIFEIYFDYNMMGGFHIISSSSWVCYANKLENKVFAKYFEKYDPKLKYDHDVNIAIYNSGLETGYLETEVKTPIYTLKGGEEFTFKETHAAAQVLSLPVLSLNETGVVTNKLTYDSKEHKVTAQYGTFIQGELLLQCFNDKNKLIEDIQLHQVSPLKGIDLNTVVPERTSFVKIIVVDKDKKEHVLDQLVFNEL